MACVGQRISEHSSIFHDPYSDVYIELLLHSFLLNWLLIDQFKSLPGP